MKKPYAVELELYKDGVKRTDIRYTSGDAETMPLSITLLKSGKPFAPEPGTTAQLNFKSIHGVKWARLASIGNNGGILYEIDPSDIAASGEVTVSVTVINGDRRLTWRGFNFAVDANPSRGQVEPPNYWKPWLESVTGRLSDYERRISSIETSGGGMGGGVTVPVAGFAAFEVSGGGDLSIVTADGVNNAFDYDPETGNLYFVTGDDKDG